MIKVIDKQTPQRGEDLVTRLKAKLTREFAERHGIHEGYFVVMDSDGRMASSSSYGASGLRSLHVCYYVMPYSFHIFYAVLFTFFIS